MTRRHVLALLAASFGSRMPATAAEASGPIVFEQGLMGTRFEIKAYHPDAEWVGKAAAEAFAAASAINDVASDYIADSELLSLSKYPHGRAVPVSSLLFSLLEEALRYAEGTDGFYDPTFGPLTRLWRESRRRKSLPAPDVLTAAREATGWRYLHLDPERSTVIFGKPGMRLDLGGIAKGQAADAMLRKMLEYGIASTSITCGGEVLLGDSPPGREGWRVGVRTYDKDRDSTVMTLSRTAVSTSGDLRQAVEIGGERYSHIIDPATGLGLTRRAAATVIAPTAGLSDALSTACCIAGPEQAREMAAALGATAVYLH